MSHTQMWYFTDSIFGRARVYLANVSSMAITRHPFMRLSSAYFDKMLHNQMMKERQKMVKAHPVRTPRTDLLRLLPGYGNGTKERIVPS